MTKPTPMMIAARIVLFSFIVYLLFSYLLFLSFVVAAVIAIKLVSR